MNDAIGKIGIIVLVALILSMLFALPTFWLWNGVLINAVTWAKEITFLQAWGINLLCAFTVKNWNVSSK